MFSHNYLIGTLRKPALLVLFFGALLGLAAPSLGAETKATQLTAHETVEQTTRELLALIQSAQDYVDEDQERYFRELGELLAKYVDFKSFSRAVMGEHASKARLASLGEAEAKKLTDQIERFSETFTGSLINTYGKGLLVFEGERIEVEPPRDDQKPKKPGRATVKQLIYGDRETPYEVYYSLRLNEDGLWKVRNMVLESTNLGKIYRNQFYNAYSVYEGDIDRIIENWVSG